LLTAASIPPLPEAASINTSCSVWKISFKPFFASAKMRLNCGVR
jgi:hypothetical protein